MTATIPLVTADAMLVPDSCMYSAPGFVRSVSSSSSGYCAASRV